MLKYDYGTEVNDYKRKHPEDEIELKKLQDKYNQQNKIVEALFDEADHILPPPNEYMSHYSGRASDVLYTFMYILCLDKGNYFKIEEYENTIHTKRYIWYINVYGKEETLCCLCKNK